MVSVESFPIVDVSDWVLVADETSGAEEKYWLQEPGADRRWLFKTVTIKEGHVHGEDWAEKAVSHLAGLIDIPCARIEMAEMNGRQGCISADLRPATDELQHGQVLLEECGAPGYVHQEGGFSEGHSLENIRDSLTGAAPPPGCSLPFQATAFDVFAGYLLLDAWIANRDRHERNWAVLRPALAGGGPLRLCGSYDHGSSLGFNVTDLRRSEILQIGGINAWCRRGTAGRFAYDRGRPMPTLVELAASALGMASLEAGRCWLDRLGQVKPDVVRNVLERVPRMSDPARTFAEQVLNVNRGRILDGCA
jgi:hypothetical protein